MDETTTQSQPVNGPESASPPRDDQPNDDKHETPSANTRQRRELRSTSQRAAKENSATSSHSHSATSDKNSLTADDEYFSKLLETLMESTPNEKNGDSAHQTPNTLQTPKRDVLNNAETLLKTGSILTNSLSLKHKKQSSPGSSARMGSNFSNLCTVLNSAEEEEARVASNHSEPAVSSFRRLINSQNSTSYMKLDKNKEAAPKPAAEPPAQPAKEEKKDKVQPRRGRPRNKRGRPPARPPVHIYDPYEYSDSSSTISSTTTSSLTDNFLKDRQSVQEPKPNYKPPLTTSKSETSSSERSPAPRPDFEVDFEIEIGSDSSKGSTRKPTPKRPRKDESPELAPVLNLATSLKQVVAKKRDPKVEVEEKLRALVGTKKLVLSRDVLEELDRNGGIRYDPGNPEMRRKHRSLEQLCFGLGCTVAPTRQELEMCSQLSLLGNDATLAEYETSVYQSCLLRSRAFQGTWRKLCNRVLGILRRYTTQGIARLLKVLEREPVVEPFLKVVLVNAGQDRQDQKLLINVLREELGQAAGDKFVVVQLSSSSVDEIVAQMYTQLHERALGGTAEAGLGDDDDQASPAANAGGITLEKLIELYSENFAGFELVPIVDRLAGTINEILYLFELLKKRKLMPIRALMIVSANNEYLENYCTSRIYSNLAIYECQLVDVAAVVEDIVKVLMFDTRVQDFVVNFHMLADIYDQFHAADNSLTLFVLRVYQLYEHYYNRYIFSYLSLVPPLAEEASAASAPSGEGADAAVMRREVADRPSEEPEAPDSGPLLPMESFVKAESGLSLADLSTTTSLHRSMSANDGEGAETTSSTASCAFGVLRDADTPAAKVEAEAEPRPTTPASLTRVKSLYSIYSLLCIANNINENYMAYLELKLGREFDLETLVFDFMPRNCLAMLKRRIMHQLGISLMFRLMEFMPEAEHMTKRVGLLSFMCDHSPAKARHKDEYSSTERGSEHRAALKHNPETKVKGVIEKVLYHVNARCNPPDSNDNKDSITLLRSTLDEFNAQYMQDIKLVAEIAEFLADEADALGDLTKPIDTALDVYALVNQVRDRLHLLLFPLVTSLPLASVYACQAYAPIFSNARAGAAGAAAGPEKESGPNSDSDADIILYIYKHVKYKIINLWKLFIMYFYLKTGAGARDSTEEWNLVELYVKFNETIELMEKLHRVLVISTPANPNAGRTEELTRQAGNLDDAQLCCLIKNSLCGLNVRFV